MPEPVLSARRLIKAYASPAGPLPVLNGVTLDVYPGESVSIRGSSGSGKTTLLQILGGLDRPDSGEVEVGLAGRRAPPSLRLGRHVGFVFQNYQLMPEFTALENVALAARITGASSADAERSARALLGRVGLAERLDHLPARLSGGECQRVALARALVNEPALLLADEPTGNLDERTAEEVMALMLGVVASLGTALVLVTHSREFAERAGRRLVLSGGMLSPA
jgi:lipoprotein-releasing system ATP-binding protein